MIDYEKISSDRYVMRVKDRYFMINEESYNLLMIYDDSSTYEEISKKLLISEEETIKVYEELWFKLKGEEKYEEELDLESIYGIIELKKRK